MALRIRLSRGGTTHTPHYSIVVIESTKQRDGMPVEKIGHYHPTKPDTDTGRVVLDLGKYDYWYSKGARPSTTVARLAKNSRTA